MIFVVGCFEKWVWKIEKVSYYSNIDNDFCTSLCKCSKKSPENSNLSI